MQGSKALGRSGSLFARECGHVGDGPCVYPRLSKSISWGIYLLRGAMPPAFVVPCA